MNLAASDVGYMAKYRGPELDGVYADSYFNVLQAHEGGVTLILSRYHVEVIPGTAHNMTPVTETQWVLDLF